MSSPETTSRRGRKASVPFWKRDLSSLGKGGTSAVEEVEHPPFVPALPSVDLLPQSVRDRITVRKVRRRFIALALLLLAGVGTAWLLQTGQIQQADDSLALEQSRNATLTAQVQALEPVQRLYNQITGQQAIVNQTLASQPTAALVVSRLLDTAAKAGVTDLASVNVDYSGIPAPGGVLNPCPNPDPFGTEVAIGCLTFTATAASREDVSRLLTALGEDPMFVGPYVTDTTASGGTGAQSIAFTGTAAISPEALATPLTAEQLTAIVTPPTPEPSATPAASPAAGGTG